MNRDDFMTAIWDGYFPDLVQNCRNITIPIIRNIFRVNVAYIYILESLSVVKGIYIPKASKRLESQL